MNTKRGRYRRYQEKLRRMKQAPCDVCGEPDSDASPIHFGFRAFAGRPRLVAAHAGECWDQTRPLTDAERLVIDDRWKTFQMEQQLGRRKAR